MISAMQLPSALAWLIDDAGTVSDAERFLTTLGARLIADGLPLAGGALTQAAPHPIITRRTWLWRADTGAVIEALRFGLPEFGLPGPADPEPASVGLDWLTKLGTGVVHEDAAGIAASVHPLRIARCSAGQRCGRSPKLNPNCWRQVARFAAAPLGALAARSTLAALLETYLGRRSAAQVLAGRLRRGDWRDHPRGPALCRPARLHGTVRGDGA